MQKWTLALDAMGVLYRNGDDVADLLIPFVQQKGGSGDETAIRELYRRASLGDISAADFWEALDLSPGIEDEYLSLHEMVPGAVPFLATAHDIVDSVCCASNDVSEWSVKLRRRFALESSIDDWIISSELGIRKPDEAFFDELISRQSADPAQIIFVDDRIDNIKAAANKGLHAILFGRMFQNHSTPFVRTYRELADYIAIVVSPGDATRISP
jgi:HAD superfamily hydrolase (TIGR01509 family)